MAEIIFLLMSIDNFVKNSDNISDEYKLAIVQGLTTHANYYTDTIIISDVCSDQIENYRTNCPDIITNMYYASDNKIVEI